VPGLLEDLETRRRQLLGDDYSAHSVDSRLCAGPVARGL
jgi:hypothetical protein